MSPKEKNTAAPVKTGRKNKGHVERINERFVKFKAYAEEVAKLLAAAGPQTDLLNLREKIGETASLVTSIAEACGGVSENLLALHKAKWNPRIGGRDVFVAGSLVMVKPRHVDHYIDFFAKEDLFSLRVVEIKGKSAKVEVFRDNLKGETLVLPAYRLQSREEKASK